MMKNNSENKISVTNIIKESLGLYKDNFALFFKISLIMFLLNSVTLYSQFLSQKNSHSDYILLYDLANTVVSFICLFFIVKMDMTQYRFIAKRFNKMDATIKDCYSSTAGFFWKYFVGLFIYGLRVFFPLIGIGLAYKYKGFNILGCTTIVILALLYFYLITYNKLIPVIRALTPDNENFISTSSKLVHDQFWSALSVFLFPSLLLALPIFFTRDFNFKFLLHVIQLFLLPFFAALEVVMFYKLSAVDKDEVSID